VGNEREEEEVLVWIVKKESKVTYVWKMRETEKFSLNKKYVSY